jgi:hypothetical protein
MTRTPIPSAGGFAPQAVKVDMVIPGLQGRDVIVEKRPVKATMEKSKEQYAGPVTKC